MELGLEGKTALIVGAGIDVGREAALLLAREGAKLVLAGRRREALEDCADRVKALGGTALVVPCDLGETASVKALVAQSVSAFGRIDLLANTAGQFPLRALAPGRPGPLFDDDESWLEAFQLVLMTAVRLTREVLPLMIAQNSGAIVHLGSHSARHYSMMTGQFGAMKAALAHTVKNWAREAGPHGVRVNAVMPGWIKGDKAVERLEQAAQEAGVSLEAMEQATVQKPGGDYWTSRMGRTDEYADAIAYLLSDRSSYINGALVPLVGGAQVW